MSFVLLLPLNFGSKSVGELCLYFLNYSQVTKVYPNFFDVSHSALQQY